MTERLSIALAQINPTLGDVAGNAEKIRAARREAAAQGADLLVCPELVMCGYPPEDLILHGGVAAACREAVESLAIETGDGGPAIILTSPWPDDPRADPRPIEKDRAPDPRPFNALLVLDGGEIAYIQYKVHLPNYGVFDEPRTFRAGTIDALSPFGFRGVRLGFLVCEDMWYADTAAHLAGGGVDLFIAPHGSPFRMDAAALRQQQAHQRVQETGCPVVFVNQVGGQDELVFDGGAFVAYPDGSRHQTARFLEQVTLTHWEKTGDGWRGVEGQAETDAEAGADGDLLAHVYSALVLGTRDYVLKSGFKQIVLGLSGGIDSAMVAAIATDALGADNVSAIMMPSRYTSDHSLEDAKACAEALGISYDIIPIEPGVGAFTQMLAPQFAGRASDVAEENIQSRLRGVLLMALSNKFGSLLLSTGNKSEMAVGYATLYGDMNGAYNPLKDVYKTTVFDLARWRNDNAPVTGQGPFGEVIPQRIITKPPSAELRENQTDQDSLPPYDILDGILTGLIEKEQSAGALVEHGYDRDTIIRIQRLLHLSEYKRRQSPPGPKISSRNFGRDRRYPIINRWRDPV